MLYSTWFDIKLVSKIDGEQQAAENTDHVPEGISLCILPVSPCGLIKPQSQNALVLYHTPRCSADHQATKRSITEKLGVLLTEFITVYHLLVLVLWHLADFSHPHCIPSPSSHMSPLTKGRGII